MSICVFGDSIAWGSNDLEKGGWVSRLKMHMLEKYDVNVYNLGISGDATEEVLKRVEAELKAREPQVIVFAIGINDSQYLHSIKNRRVSLGKFKENIRTLHTIASSVSREVVFIGLTAIDETKTKPVSWNSDIDYNTESIKEYDLTIKDFCADNGVKFIAMGNELNLDNLEDGVHPDARGHEKMFQKIKPEIEKLLAE